MEMASQPHVVVMPFPSKGHSTPFLHFAAKLTALGVTITFVNSYEHVQPQDFQSIGGLEQMKVVKIGGPVLPGDDIAKPLPMMAASERITQDLEDLLEKLVYTPGLPRPAALICDVFFGWTQDVADKFKIPKYLLFTSPSSLLALMSYVPTLLKLGRLPVGFEPFSDIPGVASLKAAEMPSMMLDHKSIPEAYAFFLRHCDRLPDARGVLVNTFEDLEHRTLECIRERIYGETSRLGKRSVLTIGPLLPAVYFEDNSKVSESNQEDTAEYLKWLDLQPEHSVLVISFGSFSSLRANQVTALANGLLESGQTFLYVCRPPAAVDGSKPIDSTLKPLQYLPEDYEERIKGQGVIVPGWIHQLGVLSHPAVGGFLTHCGWNSILESLCRGVPLLAWPLHGEQRMNKRFVVDEAKVALEFTMGPNGIVEAEEIAKVVKELFVSEKGNMVRVQAHQWKTLSAKAVAPGGSSASNLQRFVDEIFAPLNSTH